MKLLKWLNLATGLVLIVVLLIAGFYLRGLVAQQTTSDHTTVLLNTNNGCDLNQHRCAAGLGNKSVSLSFKQPVRYLTKIDIEVTTNGFETELVEKILIDFSMTGMQMGINRFALHKVREQNRWQGTVMLPVCISGRKDWQVTLYFETKLANYRAVYKLQVEN